MSILLDALRKSENQKHLGDVPTIHSTGGEDMRPVNRRKPGLVLLLALPAILVLGWYGWKYYSAGDPDTVTRSETMAVDTSRTEPADEVSGRSDPEDRRSLPEIPRVPGNQLSATPGRTPVESYSAPAQTESEEIPEIPVVSEKQPGSNIQADEAAATPAIPVPGSDIAGYRTPSFTEISYWGLPESIREDIPQPRITVLVYAEAAEDRFILMNGVRLTEGARTSSGMVLEEIRREGAVFSFRKYRFLVSR